uniref:Protein unc-45 homolog B n=2 Tax=Arion vulgaris TaxID=1028688 RepID=A0A0B7B3H2_9EUPU
MADSKSYREKGNEYFKSEKFEEALSSYDQALESSTLKDFDKAVLYKNKAACYLKLEKYKEAVEDASRSLDLSPNDPKALFRRCQGYESLDQAENAYKDVVQLIKVDPQNTAAKQIYNRLNTVMQAKVKQQNSTMNKVSQMFNICFDSSERDKRLLGLNNLIVLSGEDAGANTIIKEGGLAKLKSVLLEKDLEIVQGAVRVLATLTKGSKLRSSAIITEVGLTTLLQLMSRMETAEMASSAALAVQNIITYFTGLDAHQAILKKYEDDKKKGERLMYPHLKLSEESKSFLHEVFKGLIKMLISGKVTSFARDSAMELITKNVTSRTGVDWTKPFLETEGVENLLIVAGTQKEFKTIPVNPESSMHASVALSKIYDDLINDKLREQFKEKCHEYFRELFSDGILESKIEAVAALASLLQGPYEVGGMLLGIEGVTELMLTLADSGNPQYQKVAVEAIVSSASKKDRCSRILQDAVPILKKLYKSAGDHIKVRALVGLCKLGSFMGTDASTHPMADESTQKLAKICRKFLINANKDSDLRKWATEGLAYLTLDAEIKEDLVNDVAALRSIFDLAKEADMNTTYASVTVLVNCTNSYDKQDIMPELVELAKFAKQHIPEEHEKDKPEFVSQRIHKLAKAGVVNALVALSDTDSKNSRELLSRLYVSLASEETLRGLLIQQGGIKSLLNLMNNNTDNGTIMVAHTLAKISVTSDPHFAFPGQRIYEVVRPLLSLLNVDRSGLQNFEALMALTNLSSVSESVRSRILTEKGLSLIEHYMFEEHEMLRRAATECMCNMVISDKVQELFEGENDRVKIMVLFAGDDDIPLVQAAAGALAVLSSRPSICQKIVQVSSWLDILQVHTVSELPDIQHRACHIIMNIVLAGKDLASLVAESPMLEILIAVSKQKDPRAETATNAAQSALDKLVEYGLIQANQEGKVPELFLDILRAQLRKTREEEEKRLQEEEEEEKRRKLEEIKEKQEREKRLKEIDEKIIRDKQEFSEEDGVKIRELTEEEAAVLEAGQRVNEAEQVANETDERQRTQTTANSEPVVEDKTVEENDEIDKEELEKGDVWNNEAGLPD